MADKIKWTPTEDKDQFQQCEAMGSLDGNTYMISRNGPRLGADAVRVVKHWRAVVIRGGQYQELADGVSGHLAWQKCVDHSKGR